MQMQNPGPLGGGIFILRLPVSPDRITFRQQVGGEI